MRVLVFGTFDHLHPGHLFLLSEAERRGELFVVVARDHNVEKIKGRRPDQSEEERQTAVQKALPTARVYLGHSTDFLRPLADIQPDLILLGYDQKLPPGVSEQELPCAVERLPGHETHRFKSSLLKMKKGQ